MKLKSIRGKMKLDRVPNSRINDLLVRELLRETRPDRPTAAEPEATHDETLLENVGKLITRRHVQTNVTHSGVPTRKPAI